MPVEYLVAERYITAVHALDLSYRNRPPFPKQIDLAHDLVINGAELRRVYVLTVFVGLTKQRPCVIERFRLRQILAGHRDAQLSGREMAKRKPKTVATRKDRRLESRTPKALASAAWEPLARSQEAFDLLKRRRLKCGKSYVSTYSSEPTSAYIHSLSGCCSALYRHSTNLSRTDRSSPILESYWACRSDRSVSSPRRLHGDSYRVYHPPPSSHAYQAATSRDTPGPHDLARGSAHR